MRRRGDGSGSFEGLGGDHYDAGKTRKKKDTSICSKFFLLIKIVTVLFVLEAAALLGIYNFTPAKIDPQVYEIPFPPPEFTGPLAPNEILSKAVRILEGEIIGPESIAALGGRLYTGLWDGRIVEIYNGKITAETRPNDLPCGSLDNEDTCGRPLGVRIDPELGLVVIDAYLGIYQVDMVQGKVKTLVGADTVVNGKGVRFFNDLVISNGVIYFTHSSATWDRRDFMNILYEGKPDGRLISYNLKTKELKELVSGILFANGFEISHDGTHLLVSELALARIIRYYIAGPKAGQMDYFAENLPGFPDNIRKSNNGSYWVAYAVTRESGRFSFLDWAGDKPWVRKLLTQVIPPRFMHAISKMATPPYGLITLHDGNGKIISSLHDPKGKVISGVSEARQVENVLYLGSFSEPYLGRVEI